MNTNMSRIKAVNLKVTLSCLFTESNERNLKKKLNALMKLVLKNYHNLYGMIICSSKELLKKEKNIKKNLYSL